MLDAGKLIAGNMVLVHRNALVGQYSYRDPDFDWYGVGHRLMDFIFEWASKCGYAEYDLGGLILITSGDGAPQDGEKWHIRIRPELSYRMRQLRETRWKLRFQGRFVGSDTSCALPDGASRWRIVGKLGRLPNSRQAFSGCRPFRIAS